MEFLKFQFSYRKLFIRPSFEPKPRVYVGRSTLERIYAFAGPVR